MISLPAEILALASPDKIVRDFSLLTGRVGLFGGSFDPIHRVHLEIADELLAQNRVDRIVFIPAAQNPLKTVKPVSDQDRMAMLLLAIAARERMFVSPIELDRGSLSYTVETLEQISRTRSERTELFFIIGSDSLAQLPQWHRVDEIFSYCRILVVQRDRVMDLQQWHHSIDGLALDARCREQLKADFILRAPNTVSSTAIRSHLTKGYDPHSVTEAVAGYIKLKNLYR